MLKRNQKTSMAKDLKIVNWNCRSIFSNLGEFQKFLDDAKPHLVGLTETWLKPNKTVNFKGYEVLRCDRVNGLQGGHQPFFPSKTLETLENFGKP